MAKDILSRREREVFNLIAKGLNNADAAAHLMICPCTVKFHLTRIYKKLGIKSRSKLIVSNFMASGDL